MGNLVIRMAKSIPKRCNNKIQVVRNIYNNFAKEINQKQSSTGPPSLFENLRNYFSEYCTSSGVHGVRYLGEHGRFLIEKLTWIIVIILVWYFCISSICKAYNKWTTSPVIVTFATRETAIFEIPFPAVTICPEVKSDPEIFNFTDVFLKKLFNESVTPEENKYYESLSLICTSLDEGFSEMEVFRNGNLTVTDSVIDNILDVWPLFIPSLTILRWLGKEYEINATLSGTFTNEGFCYTFNRLSYDDILAKPEEYATKSSIKDTSSKMWSLDDGYPSGANMDAFPRRTFMSGITGGFEIEIYTNDSHLDYLCKDSLQGFKVALHHPSELPNMDRHIRVPLDQAVLVAVKPRMIKLSEELKMYKARDRECYFTEERSLSIYKFYTQQNCLDECLSNYTLKTCGCVPFYMPKLDEDPICGPGSKDCLKSSKISYLLDRANFGSNGNDDAHSACDCLPSCTSLEYDVEISQTDWNWMKTYQAFKNVKEELDSLDYETAHVSRLAVYYREMQFLSSERHEVYGALDFFANTGGLLGLFIGFSVTSAIEILYFLTLRVVCNIKKFGKHLWSGQPKISNN